MMMMQMLMTTMMYTSILALSATTLSQEEVDFEEGSTKSSRFTWQVITKGGNRLHSRSAVDCAADRPLASNNPFFLHLFYLISIAKAQGSKAYLFHFCSHSEWGELHRLCLSPRPWSAWSYQREGEACSTWSGPCQPRPPPRRTLMLVVRRTCWCRWLQLEEVFSSIYIFGNTQDWLMLSVTLLIAL